MSGNCWWQPFFIHISQESAGWIFIFLVYKNFFLHFPDTLICLFPIIDQWIPKEEGRGVTEDILKVHYYIQLWTKRNYTTMAHLKSDWIFFNGNFLIGISIRVIPDTILCKIFYHNQSQIEPYGIFKKKYPFSNCNKAFNIFGPPIFFFILIKVFL